MSANTDRLALVAKIHREAAVQATAEADAAEAALILAVEQEAADAEAAAALAAEKAALAAPVETPVVDAEPAPAVEQPVDPNSQNSPEGLLAAEDAAQDAQDGLPVATPAAVAHAEALGVDLTQVEGTGKDGTVTKADVAAAATEEPAA